MKNRNIDFSRELTVSSPVTFSGIGVHSGKPSKVTIRPREAGKGIMFYKNNTAIELKYENIKNSQLCTKLAFENEEISTIEHLLSAIYGVGISNAEIYTEGDEVPILDGSSLIFADKLNTLLLEQDKKRGFIHLPEIISINKHDKYILALPSERLEIIYILDYGTKAPGFLYEKFIYSPEAYLRDISPARTFGYLHEAEYLRSKGMALGATYENTLVINEEGFSQSLRFENEPAKHKVLDMIGDLAVLGAGLKVKIIACKTGHAENLELVNMLRRVKVTSDTVEVTRKK